MRINKSLITYIPTSGSGSGSVTSVALTAPTGFVVSGSPITSSGTLAITFASGYALPTTAKQGQWDTAYNRSLTSIGVSGTTTKTLTLTEQDGSTLTASWTDLNTGTVTSVALSVPTGLTVTGSPITTSGTLAITLTAGYSIPTTAKQTEWDSAYSNRITNLTTTGNSGSATLISNTLNVPTYTLVGLGGMSNPFSAALGQLIYSNSAGAPLSLSPNTTTTKKFLSMTGDGTNGAAPVWETISGITGSGTTNYVAKFTSSSAVGNSLIFDNGTNVGINNASPAARLHVTGTFISTAFWNDSGGVNYWGSYNAAYGALTWDTGYARVYATSGNALYFGANGNNTHAAISTSGNFGIGNATPQSKLQVSGGGLATSGSGFMVSSDLTNGRLETYESGTATCIHSYLDRATYEISAGSTSAYVSGLVITGRDASLLPDRVAIYTRSVQRFQIGSLGQLQLNAYTSASSFTGTPTAYLACDSSGNIITSNPSSGRSTRLAFSAEVPNTWSNMPNTLQFFDSSSAYVTQIDLTAYNQVRLIVNKQGTAGASGSKLLVRYQATTGAPFTESSYLAIGTSEVSLAVDTTNNILVTSWIDLVSGAKSDVWVALMGIDGDTTADPVFGNIYAEFRFV